jgi:hypothetical protein
VRPIRLLALLPLTAALIACEDPVGWQMPDVRLVVDTVTITAQGIAEDQPSALDATVPGVLARVLGGTRYPERVDVRHWDFVLRRDGADFFLYPAAALGLDSLNSAAFAPAPGGASMDEIDRAPPRSQFESVTPLRLQSGIVSVHRTRVWLAPGGGPCQQFGKLQPIEMDLQAGTVRLAVATNPLCSDERLLDTL